MIPRAITIWGPGWLKARWRRPRFQGEATRHVLLAVADHFEPFREGCAASEARNLTRDWLMEYRRAMAPFRDAGGYPPQHTFFYPGDAYDHDCVAAIATFCREGWGETEIQLHHRHDSADSLLERLRATRHRLHREHGLLGRDRDGRVRFGFVHGNWALCNSRPDRDWCGVNSEIEVLLKAGCYADFTFPSAPSPTQPRTVNTLYRAVDKPDGGPRGHDAGVEIRVLPPDRDPPHGLPMVPGPLTLDWGRRKWGVLPRLENAELSGVNPPRLRRMRRWIASSVHVRGRPEWVFVKLHTHGCVAANRVAVLGDAMRGLHRDLAAAYNDGRKWQLHYVSAREMYNLVRAAESGASGNPNPWRDYEIQPPVDFVKSPAS